MASDSSPVIRVEPLPNFELRLQLRSIMIRAISLVPAERVVPQTIETKHRAKRISQEDLLTSSPSTTRSSSEEVDDPTIVAPEMNPTLLESINAICFFCHYNCIKQGEVTEADLEKQEQAASQAEMFAMMIAKQQAEQGNATYLTYLQDERPTEMELESSYKVVECDTCGKLQIPLCRQRPPGPRCGACETKWRLSLRNSTPSTVEGDKSPMMSPMTERKSVRFDEHAPEEIGRLSPALSDDY